tara:strand:+ start:3416 stop:4426 length:1011 start_codon:yes stop_codon:yes gene_type:complete
MSSNIRIFGAGDWGLAFALHLSKKHKIDVFIRNNKKYLDFCKKFSIGQESLINRHESNTGNWSETSALQDNSLADIVACSSAGFFELISENINYFSKCQSVAWLTKGIDNKTGKLFHEIIDQALGDNVGMCVLSGPSFAADLVSNKSIEISIASNKSDLLDKMTNLISSNNFTLIPTQDLIGVQISGIIKNIAATMAGIVTALNYEQESNMLIIEKAKEEIYRISSSMQSTSGPYTVEKSEILKTLDSPACHGDLVLTCLNDISRNRQFGYRIAKGENINSVLKDLGTVESFSATKTLHSNKEKFNYGEITDSIYKILFENSNPAPIVKKLINPTF